MNETIHIDGMSCDHCVRAVEEALRAVPGLRQTTVAVGSVQLDVDPEAGAATVVEAARSAIRAEGYTPRD